MRMIKQTLLVCVLLIVSANAGCGPASQQSTYPGDAPSADSLGDADPSDPALSAGDCTDGIRNGLETDTDCGGPSCSPCQDNQGCALAVDCGSQVCTNAICQPPSCTDAVQNGTETDTDCGGASCGRCSVDKMCNVGADCASNSCSGNKCTSSNCTDGQKNGDETDTDCGGSCGRCNPGRRCVSESDCNTANCAGSKCVALQSCSAIHSAHSAVQSGVWMIDPSQGASTAGPFAAYCDMTDEGGGWTLVLSYNHAGGTNPALASGTRPLDPVNGFSHYSQAQLAQAVFTELRFYCQTSLHARRIHFKTSSAGAIAYLRGAGGNDPMYWSTGFTTLSGHTANLPAATDAIQDTPNIGLTDFPFYKAAAYHWGVGGFGDRWECDDYPADSSATTLHRVWIR